MAFEQIIVLIIILFIIIALYTELLRAPTTFFIAAVGFGIFGVLSPSEILSGFANEQVAVIVLLLIISSVIKRTQVLDFVFDKLFATIKSYRSFMFKMMAAVSSSSAFLNNTPIVAILTPYVYDWSRKNNIAPSKLLIPLSYAAILGGTVTLVGTSTNLIVNGLLTSNNLESFDMFSFSIVGIPLVILGTLYMMFIGHRLLPAKKDVIDTFQAKSREYLVETKLEKGSPLIGQTVEQAELRQLKGLFLAEILRSDEKITPVAPAVKLEEGDVLIFAGAVETISELLRSSLGLHMPATDSSYFKQSELNLVEVVVTQNSGMIGKNLQDTDFRGKYDAAIVAVHRDGERLSGKIGDIQLKSGDVLLVIAGEDFWKRVDENPGLYTISKPKKIHKIRFETAFVLIAGLIGAILLSAFHIVPLFISLLVVLALILLFEFVPFNEIRQTFDFNLLIIIAFALTIGKAMMNTGTAQYLTDHMLSVFQYIGPIGVLFGIYLITNLLTEIMTNVAAASLTFPLAISSAQSIGEPIMPFALAVAYGASASFITPIGYQTNLMVYGPGGYTFKDFFRVGFPLTLLYMVATVIILGFAYDLF